MLFYAITHVRGNMRYNRRELLEPKARIVTVTHLFVLCTTPPFCFAGNHFLYRGRGNDYYRMARATRDRTNPTKVTLMLRTVRRNFR